MELLHKEITEKIIQAYYKVYNTLGYGFLERVYENSMMIELKKMILNADKQYAIKVFYEGEIVGDYFADILVEGTIIIEIKAATQLKKEHMIQLRNYLKATDVEVGLLINFGEKPEFKRIFFENIHK